MMKNYSKNIITMQKQIVKIKADGVDMLERGIENISFSSETMTLSSDEFETLSKSFEFFIKAKRTCSNENIFSNVNFTTGATLLVDDITLLEKALEFFKQEKVAKPRKKHIEKVKDWDFTVEKKTTVYVNYISKFLKMFLSITPEKEFSSSLQEKLNKEINMIFSKKENIDYFSTDTATERVPINKTGITNFIKLLVPNTNDLKDDLVKYQESYTLEKVKNRLTFNLNTLKFIFEDILVSEKTFSLGEFISFLSYAFYFYSTKDNVDWVEN
jgi:hypothetical protein